MSEQTAGEIPAPGETPEQPTTPETQEPGDEWGDAFDAGRARTLIAKLRQEARTASKALKDLDTLKAEKQQRDQASLTEVEQARQRTEQLQAELDSTKQQAADRELEHAIERQAASLGIIDPSAARVLLDREALEFDSDGRPTNVAAILKNLLREKPYLQAQAPHQSAHNPATRAASGEGKRTYTQSELKDFAFFSKHKDDIRLAMSEGRVLRD